MRGTLGAGRKLAVYDLGTVPYREALQTQHRLVEQLQQGLTGDTLLLLEHPPVITQGRSASDEDILAAPALLDSMGVERVRIERGGETTYHGPGQLVGYPVVDLRHHARSLKTFVNLLEEVFVSYLERFHQIEATRDPEHRGVWVGDSKITAVGIAVQQRVTFHGFAFNVNTDLSHFDWIIPCGITDRGQTSLAALTGNQTPMEQVKRDITRVFCEIFGFAPQQIRQADAAEVPSPLP